MHSVLSVSRGLLLAFTLTLVTPGTSSSTVWPVGDPNRCLEMFAQTNQNIKRFAVYPGLGWDNLRNVEAGEAVRFTFDQCKLTTDGRYLIPDNVFTVPLKTSQVEQFAEMIDQWQNTSSLTAHTVNAETGLNFIFAKISGKYSQESMKLKKKQIEDKAVTTRVKLQYKRYEAKLEVDPPLSKGFKSRLMDIAARIELDHTEMARYLSQLVVRDFGTHVLRSVTAGAALIKEDFLKYDYISTHTMEKTKILASASASFYKIFKFSSDLKSVATETVDSNYSKHLTYSHIRALGGPKVSFDITSVSQWSSQVDENLVSVDRAGDPLYYLITPKTLPKLPTNLAIEVAQYVREAIEVYYEMNVIQGCTRRGAPEFSPLANFDDGSCTSPPTTTYFAGIYQTCSVSGRYLYTNPCSGLSEVNPKTGKHSCPPSYTAVRIFQGSELGRMESTRSCRRCGFLWLRRCCTTYDYQAKANYEAYWCAATENVAPESGYMFGGVYTSRTVNLVTGVKGCPRGFIALKLLGDMSVCVSDDFELSKPFSVPFGGFFSCQKGNPLVNISTSPARCPEGYSQHLAAVVTGCAFHYCLESGALSGPNLPAVERPPFMLKPVLPMETDPQANETYAVFDMEQQTWMKGAEARNFLLKQEAEERTAEGSRTGAEN